MLLLEYLHIATVIFPTHTIYANVMKTSMDVFARSPFA